MKEMDFKVCIGFGWIRWSLKYVQDLREQCEYRGMQGRMGYYFIWWVCGVIGNLFIDKGEINYGGI